MNKKIDEKTLQGEWIHSHEEDEGDEAVFRPASYDFPLTRRPRESFELKAGGELVKNQPTASDSTSEAQGKWELEDDKVIFQSESGANQTKQIASCEEDKLVLKK